MCARADLNTHGPTARYLARILFSDVVIETNSDLRPTELLPALVMVDGRRVARLLRWGLVPSWAKDRSIGAKCFNARVESAAEMPAFRDAMRHRRCVLVVDAFYEWTKPKKQSEKMRVTMADPEHPVLLAGLWERWHGAGEVVESCTVLTCEPNELLAPIHDRMPVVLAEGAIARWLDPAVTSPGAVRDLLRPYPAEEMRVKVADE